MDQDRPDAGRRATRTWLLAAAVLVGGALRFQGLGVREINMDEAFSWRMIQFPTREMLQRLGDDVHPPLYYLALKLWAAAFGDSLVGLRSLSALLGTGAIVAAGLLTDRAGHASGRPGGAWSWAGALAAGLVALSPFQVSYSRSARMYPLGVLLAALSSWLLLRAVVRRGPALRRWLAYSLAAAAFLYTHHYAAFTLAAHALLVLGTWVAASRKGEPASGLLRGAAVSLAVITLLYLPWVPSQIRQVRSVMADYWIPPLTVQGTVEIGTYFVTGIGGSWFPDEPTRWLICLTGAAAVLTLLIRPTSGRLFLLALVVVPWLGGVGLPLLGGRTVLVERYLIFAHLPFLAALAIGAMRLRSRRGRAVLAELLLSGCLIGLVDGREADYPLEPRGALERLTRRLSETAGPDHLVLIEGPGLANQVLYYASHSGLADGLQIIGSPAPDIGHQVYAASVPEGAWLPDPGLLNDERRPVTLVEREGGVVVNHRLTRPAVAEVFSCRGGSAYHLIRYAGAGPGDPASSPGSPESSRGRHP